MPACYIHRDPDSWEEPNAFDPGALKKIPAACAPRLRLLSSSSLLRVADRLTTKKQKDRWEKKPVRGTFVPFSDGARNCAGRNFAVRSRCVLASLDRWTDSEFRFASQRHDVAVCAPSCLAQMMESVTAIATLFQNFRVDPAANFDWKTCVSPETKITPKY